MSKTATEKRWRATQITRRDWIAYQDMWWILDDQAEEFCAVGIHGQVIYVNRSTDTVMVWFSSQPMPPQP